MLGATPPVVKLTANKPMLSEPYHLTLSLRSQTLSILALLALAACSSPPGALKSFEPTVATGTLSARNAKTLGWLTVAGQPNQEDIAILAAAGTGCIINMRTAEEMEEVEFDEAAVAASHGMRYAHLPVSGVESLTGDFFVEARGLLGSCKSSGVLLH